MGKCEKCLYYKSKTKCGECGRLSNAMDNNPMFTPNTNYDRIKSMSVEEMADIFNYLAESCGDISGTCNGCIMYVKRGMNDNCHKLTCTETIKRWLLQEVSDE